MEQSVIDKLMELKRLYEAGILTKEELEAEKQKVLENEIAEETPQNEIVVQKTVSSPSAPTEKSDNKGLWLVGAGVLATIIIIICVIVSNSQKADPVHKYATAIDSLTDDYTDDYVYEEEVVEDIYEDNDLYEIDDWAGTFVITGYADHVIGGAKAILTLKKTDRKSYYMGTMYCMFGDEMVDGQFDAYNGTMTANVKAKLQDDQLVVVLDDFTIGEVSQTWFDSFKQGQQIFCITNFNGVYSVRVLGEMEFFYSFEKNIYKQY